MASPRSRGRLGLVFRGRFRRRRLDSDRTAHRRRPGAGSRSVRARDVVRRHVRRRALPDRRRRRDVDAVLGDPARLRRRRSRPRSLTAEDGLGRDPHGRRLQERGRRRDLEARPRNREPGVEGDRRGPEGRGVRRGRHDGTESPACTARPTAASRGSTATPAFRTTFASRPSPSTRRRPATLYAGTRGDGVFKSSDSGATWAYTGRRQARQGVRARARGRSRRQRDGLGRRRRRGLSQRRLRKELGEEEHRPVAAVRRRRLRDRPDQPEDRVRRRPQPRRSRRRTWAAAGPRSRRASTGSISRRWRWIPRERSTPGPTARAFSRRPTAGGTGRRRRTASRPPTSRPSSRTPPRPERSTSAPFRATCRRPRTAARHGRACPRA